MTIPEALDTYEAETLARDIPARERVRFRRAYMSGALEATLRIQAGEPAADVLRQLADYGRVIATPAERATN